MEDRFSAAFTSYITMGNRAAGATQLAQSSARNYQTVLAGLDRQIISLNGEFAAGAQRQAEPAPREEPVRTAFPPRFETV